MAEIDKALPNVDETIEVINQMRPLSYCQFTSVYCTGSSRRFHVSSQAEVFARIFC